MKWEHRCSLDWLRDRQRFITASDVKALLPVTKTGRPRLVTDVDRLKVMASKMVELTEEDCMSYGVMARGHLLEPYAVDALNQMLLQMQGPKADVMHWWDDMVVSVDGRSLAFSPDAMDVPMDDPDYMDKVTAIAEVKCYDPAHHLAVAYSKPEDIEERWQIAAAMALLPSIDHAYLVLFNPRMRKRKTFVITFSREDLEDEIEMVLKVEKEWDEFRSSGALTKHPASGGVWSGIGGSEAAIIEEIEARQRLNP